MLTDKNVVLCASVLFLMGACKYEQERGFDSRQVEER